MQIDSNQNEFLYWLKRLSPFHFNLSAKASDVPPHIQQSMQYSVWEGGLTGIMAVFTGGVVLTGFALALGANDLVIGLLASLQAGANLFQIRAFQLLERNGRRKKLTMRFALASRLLWIPICLLAFANFAPIQTYRMWLFLFLFASAVGLGIFSAVPWISWLVDLVPENVRGRFFAQRNLAAGAVGVILGIAAGKFIDWWSAQAIAPEPFAFAILVFVGLLFGFGAILCMRKMHEPPFPKPPQHLSFWESLKIPFRDDNFRRLFYFRVCYDLSMGIAGTFYGVYMLTEARLNFTLVSTLVMLTTLTNLLSLKPWGKFLDRFGNKPILQICIIGKAVFAVLWIFTTPDTIWLYVIIHLFGVFDAGNAIAIPNLVYKLAPTHRRANYIAVDGTVVGIAATVAPLIGGSLAMLFADWRLDLGFFHGSHFHCLFLIAAVLRLGTFYFLKNVREPQSKSVAQVINVIRPIRGIDAFEGFQQALHSLLAPARYVIEKLVDKPARRKKRREKPGERTNSGQRDGL